MKTYLCSADIILENGEVLDDPLFWRQFYVTVPAGADRIQEDASADMSETVAEFCRLKQKMEEAS